MSVTLIALGALLLLTLAAGWLGRHTPLPRVSVLLLIGVVVGPAGFGLLPDAQEDWEPIATTLALSMVGFLLGAEFEGQRLREHGRRMLVVAITQSVVTSAVVAGGLALAGWSLPLALALGGIAPASAAAAMRVVVKDQRADGPMTRTLLGVVAIEDSIGIVMFSVLGSAAAIISGSGGTTELLLAAARELGGGVALGLAIGAPAALLTGRLREGEPTLLEALGIVLLIGGLGQRLEVSFLLAAVVAGTTVVNLARHHERPFDAIEEIDWPFLAVFFLLGGAALRWEELTSNAAVVAAYVVLRAVGKIAGGYLGGHAAHMEAVQRRWLGPSLLPQAGVALGLALLAGDRIPDVAGTVIPVIVVSTVGFELVGPIVTRAGLRRTGEAGVIQV